MFRDNSDLGDGGGGGRGEERDQLHHSGATLDTDLESLALTEVTIWLVLINFDIDTVRWIEWAMSWKQIWAVGTFFELWILHSIDVEIEVINDRNLDNIIDDFHFWLCFRCTYYTFYFVQWHKRLCQII